MLFRPAEKGQNLQADVCAYAVDLGFRDHILRAQSSDQGIVLAGGDASHVGLHHHGI